MIDYELLEDEYENIPKFAKVARSTKPEGSLTDNARLIEPNRNGAWKRVRALENK